MTFRNRAKLVFGVLVVLLIVAASTFVFNQRNTQVLSDTASINAALYDVGTDYGGEVTAVYAEAGDTVTTGQALFEVESLQLARDLEAGTIAPGQADTTAQGTLVIRAGTDGTLGSVAVNAGSYASPGQVLATIEGKDSLFASAEFVLTPRDFGRIEELAAVELRLPDQQEVVGQVVDFAVTTVDGNAHVVARIESDALVRGDGATVVKPGTPLEATLLLRDDGPLAGVDDMLEDFARRIGL